jgi:hypothetical protein
MSNGYVIQVDATHNSVPNLPTDLIAVAGYVTGTPDILWTTDDWDRFPLAGLVRIDQSPSLSVFAEGNADHARVSEADIESGAGTIAAFVDAARRRESMKLQSTAYVDMSDYPSLVNAVGDSDVGGVRYFIADWSLDMDEAIAKLEKYGNWVGVQFASPSSNPNTNLPGSGLTLATANADLSVKRGTWFPSTALAACAWAE